jgi:hypothetical protein
VNLRSPAHWLACIALAGMLLPVPAMAGCPPQDMGRNELQAMKTLRFQVPEAADRNTIALALVDCLGDPDPLLRDGIAYEGLAHWMRAGQLEPGVLRSLRDRLYARIDEGEGDGFARPFAALVLSEVARTDRIAAWMTPHEREAMVRKAADYLATVQDYRGFDNAEGWRHGVAHGADWALQLALNPALERAQGDRLLAAVAAQVVPGSAHAYVSGEPGRLARPVVALARSGLYGEDDWQTWFAALPARIGDPELAYADEDWLARRHDLVAFLLSLYIEADQSQDAAVAGLKPAIVSALKSVP